MLLLLLTNDHIPLILVVRPEKYRPKFQSMRITRLRLLLQFVSSSCIVTLLAISADLHIFLAVQQQLQEDSLLPLQQSSTAAEKEWVGRAKQWVLRP